MAGSYPASEVSADRDRLAEQVLMALSQPEVIADEELGKRLYPGSSGCFRASEPRRSAAGERADFRRMHAPTFAPNLGHFVLVGDVTPAGALLGRRDACRSSLGSLRPRSTLPPQSSTPCRP